MLCSNVLLLNQNYEPLSLCSARRAIVLVWSGKAEMLEDTGFHIRSVSRSFPVPAVIRLLMIAKITRGLHVQLTKRNILRRDQGICQYCGVTGAFMTIDHVIPRSLGGRDTWENLVCACPSCNNRKGDNSPDHVGMQLLRMPRKPNPMSFLSAYRGPGVESWQTYLKIS